MSNEIREEQEKLAKKLKALSADEREKQAYGIMCWLQGHEAGYQAGISAGGQHGENVKG